MLRRIEVLVLAGILLIAALSTGAQFLFFLVYLGILVVGGSYVLTRFGLADLEAGYVLDRLHAQAGDILRASYTVRNTSRLPKLWLEVHNPTTLPVAAARPGGHARAARRAVVVGPRAADAARPLPRSSRWRCAPAIRSGLFESHATVGSHSTVIVYPRVESLPGWRLPPAFIEGSHAQAVRTPQTTPHATGIRPYAPGDAYNRIHWRAARARASCRSRSSTSSRRPTCGSSSTSQARAHAGDGDESTLEYGVRAAASIAARALRREPQRGA